MSNQLKILMFCAVCQKIEKPTGTYYCQTNSLAPIIHNASPQFMHEVSLITGITISIFYQCVLKIEIKRTSNPIHRINQYSKKYKELLDKLNEQLVPKIYSFCQNNLINLDVISHQLTLPCEQPTSTPFSSKKKRKHSET